MKSYTQYLMESKKSWKFKIKTIHELTDDQCDRIEKHLLKYDSNGLGAAKKTMLQSTPTDFPNHRGYEVYRHEFEVNLPVSGYQIQTEIQNLIGLRDGVLKVKGEHEIDADEEVEQTDVKSVLEDGEYSEAEKVNSDDFYGDEYNKSFIKELAKIKKQKEKGNE